MKDAGQDCFYAKFCNTAIDGRVGVDMRALLCGFVLLTACQQPPGSGERPEPEPKPDPPGHTAQVRFAPGLDAANSGEFQEVFKLLGQRDIVAIIDVDTTDVSNTDGVFFMHFDVINPMGVPMQTQWQAFSSAASAPTEILHPEFQEMIDVQKITKDEGWVHLRANIPVAGTPFTRNKLVGEFSGVVYLGLEATVTPTVSGTFEMEL